MALKVCILRTDAVLDEFQPEFGDYPDMFTRLLHTADEHLDIVSVDVRSDVPTTLDCDAYVITGSRHSVYEPLPWIEALVGFLRSAIAANKRVVGICFGHQLLAHFFGGEVQGAEQGWGVGVHQAKIVARLPWMTGAEAVNGAAALNTDEELALLCSHKDQVTRLPEGATLFASSDFCPYSPFKVTQNSRKGTRGRSWNTARNSSASEPIPMEWRLCRNRPMSYALRSGW